MNSPLIKEAGMKVKLIASLTLFTLLSGCSEMRQTFGLDKKTPDEFAVDVYDRAPLTLPPDFELRPPMSGSGSTSSLARQEAESLLSNNSSAAPTDLSPGEAEILSKAATNMQPTSSIRPQVNQEARLEKQTGNVPSATRFSWQKAKAGDVIDPVSEKKRLDDIATNQK